MESIQLERSELLALLDLKGVSEVIGVGPEHLAAPEAFERSITLDDGRSRLLEQERLSVQEDHYEIEPSLEAMLAILVDPQTVLRVQRTTPGRDELFWSWYFISESALAQMTASGPEQFFLSRVSDIDSALAQIGEMLPVEPVADTILYRATVDQEDADLISALVDDWDEVPALSILEADGLAPIEALEFYDDLTEPKWIGRVDLMGCSSGKVDVYHRMLVLQGRELSWLAWQDDPDKSDLHLQTATEGAFEEHLVAYLSQISP